MSLNVNALRQSFELVIERAPNLTERFYDVLFTRYPQVRPLFGRRARPQQEQMLAQALSAVLDHLEDAPWLQRTLGALGAKHVGYGVRDEMYAWVGDALLATLADVAAADWSPELASAWSDAYGAITSLMLDGARQAHAAA
jgi:hemoglobin-like flavoprotein